MILVAAVLLLLLAWLLNLSLLVYAGYVLVGLYVISHVLTSGWIQSLEARRDMTAVEASEGDTVSIAVPVRNGGRWPVSWMMLEDVVAEYRAGETVKAIEVSGRRVDVTDLRPGKSTRLHYQLRCRRRGYYQIGPLVAETGDWFGLNRRYRVLCGPDFLLVKPRIVTLTGYEISSRRPIGEVVMAHRLYEDPTRISGIREYQIGDALSRIHWRATARTGRLQSKVYEPSTVAGATILLDFHSDSFGKGDEPVRSELAVLCAASIASAVHEMGQQVGLVSNGRDAADRIRAEGWQGDRRSREEARQSASMSAENSRLRPVIVGTRRADDQFANILNALARLEKNPGAGFLEMIAEAEQRMPRDATIIAILTRVDMESGVALGSLRRRGYAVTAIVNCFDEEQFAHVSGVLSAEGIGVRHLRDEASVAEICRQLVLLA